MLPDLLEVALHVVQVLEGNGVTYLIGGSLASAHFGIPRSTLGVDLYFCSPEDIILHKLDWYRQGGGLSDRQWNDVLGVLKVQAGALDSAYLRHWAKELYFTKLLEQALTDASLTL